MIISDQSFDPIGPELKGFDPNKKRFLAEPVFKSSPLAMVDIISGKTTFLKDIPVEYATFDSKGNICGFHKTKEEYNCYDVKDQREISSSSLGINRQRHSVRFIGDSKNLITQIKFGGNKETTIHIPSKECVDLNIISECRASGTQKSLSSDLIQINEKLLCEKDFDSRSWPVKARDYSDDQARLWLKKISKPNSLNVSEDMLVLEHMVQNGAHHKYPAEFSAAVVGLSASNLAVFEEFMKMHPELEKLPAPDMSCLTANEKEKIKAPLIDYVDYFMFKNDKSVENYSRLKNTLSLFSEKEKDDYADRIADKVLLNADEAVRGVFSSKLHKFYYNDLKRSFGIPYKNLTDVTTTRSSIEIESLQLSMDPSDDAYKTPSGLYLRRIARTSTGNISPGSSSMVNHEWNYAGTNYKSQIKIEKMDNKAFLTNNSPAPDYVKMGGGKELNGIVIAGSNLGGDLTDSVVRSYIDYYVKEGFVFSKPKSKVKMASYLEERLTGKNPVHYLVKEAHSDGDEKNLLRMSNNGKVLTGTRMKNGKKETIEILYPAEENVETSLISNEDFGVWLRKREKTNKQPLIYLNSSCWSDKKAVNEISAAATNVLVNIPTSTTMSVFVNHPDNVMRIVIDGLRNKKTYKEMRDKMDNVPGYQTKTGNVFIFPDEDLYKQKVSDLVETPINVDIQISKELKNKTWQKYSIEQEH